MDDVVGEEPPAGWRTEQGVGFRRGFSRPRCTNGWADGMAVGNHGLETRLSEMWGKLRKYPHRFELGGSFGSGVSRAFRVSGFHRRWEFSRALYFRNRKARVEMEGVVGAQRDKDIS